MSFKPKERRRDFGRDARERRKERLDAAFDLARKIQAEEIEKLRQAGLRGEKLKKKTPNLIELADSLLANHSDAIDRIVEEKKKQLAEMSKKAKSGISDARGRSLGSKKLESLASGFKDHLQRKKDSSDKEDDQPERSASKQPSLKEVMDDARRSTIERLADRLQRQVEGSDKKISFFDLNSVKFDDDRLKDFRDSVQRNKESIEHILRKRLGFESGTQEVKLGVVDNRIYTWKIDRTPNDMLNVWGDRYFYFKKKEFSKLIDDLSTALNLSENNKDRTRHLNQLVRNMISSDPASKILHREHRSRLIGDMLHFARDALGRENSDFEGKMVKVASRHGRGPIYNPKLPTGERIERLRAELGAAVNSDCWLGNDGRMYYYEANHDRIEIFQKQLQKLGDLELRLQPVEGRKSYKMYLPRPIGYAFIYWDFPTDDKAARNARLSRFIREGKDDDWKAYLRNLIPEDGSFNDRAGFQWSRSIVLNPGKQDAKYGLSPQVNKEQTDFIIENGRRDSKRKYIHLQLSEHLNNDAQFKSDIVRSLESVIERNRSRLLDDEVKLARNVGVKMRVYPESITLYEDTGRISIKWVATTKDIENTIRWFLLVPPNDIRKYETSKEWMSKRPDVVERVRRQLISEGLLKEEDGGPGEI